MSGKKAIPLEKIQKDAGNWDKESTTYDSSKGPDDFHSREILRDRGNKGQLGALLMVGIALSEEMMTKLTLLDCNPLLQGHKHQWAMIRCIESGTGRPVELLTWPAIGDYPRHPALWLRGGRWSHREGAEDRWIFFINIFGLKPFTRFVGIFYHTLRWLVRHRHKESRAIFLYNAISAPLWAVILAKSIFAVSTCVACILADYPSKDLPGEGWLYRGARRIDRWLQIRGLSQLNGIVSLSKWLAVDLAPGVPYVVMEGVVSGATELETDARSTTAAIRTRDEFVVMYGGRLEESQGVRILLDAIDALGGEVTLWICGKGPLEGEVQRRIRLGSPVKYFGVMPNSEMLNLASLTDILVCPRMPDAWDTKYSFPSKLIEYMATGVAVVATKLSVIPEEYDPFVIWSPSPTSEGLRSAFEAAKAKRGPELKQFGVAAKEFVLDKKGEVAQGHRLRSFLASII